VGGPPGRWAGGATVRFSLVRHDKRHKLTKVGRAALPAEKRIEQRVGRLRLERGGERDKHLPRAKKRPEDRGYKKRSKKASHSKEGVGEKSRSGQNEISRQEQEAVMGHYTQEKTNVGMPEGWSTPGGPAKKDKHSTSEKRQGLIKKKKKAVPEKRGIKNGRRPKACKRKVTQFAKKKSQGGARQMGGQGIGKNKSLASSVKVGNLGRNTRRITACVFWGRGKGEDMSLSIVTLAQWGKRQTIE